MHVGVPAVHPCAHLEHSTVLIRVYAPNPTGIMHRDLKPSNILLSHAGCAKLADWGLGRPFDLAAPPPGARPAAYTHTVATRW
jgi:serine/threonine protein kinase